MAGMNCRHGSVVVAQEFRSEGQQIAARGAFGPADFKQHGVDLVFDLDGVDHQGAVFPSLVDEDDGRCADGDEHQKSRRKQQDLPNRAPARGVNRHKCLT